MWELPYFKIKFIHLRNFETQKASECQRYYNKRPEEFCPCPLLHAEHIAHLPYIKQVRSYYKIIRKFVCRVALWIDSEGSDLEF